MDDLQVASRAPRHVPEGKTVIEEEKTARAGQADDAEKPAESSHSVNTVCVGEVADVNSAIPEQVR